MTCAQPAFSRRTLLVAATGAALAGCTARSGRPAADPDAAALDAARHGELDLLANYAPGEPAHDLHLAHLQKLGGAPTPLPTTTAGPVTARAAAAAEAASVAVLQHAAVSAERGDTAALLASVAASHAVLAQP